MIISSIDLSEGKAVQLRQGREKMLEKEDPKALAREFERFGETAVIDLDAAMGKGHNAETIKELLKITECRVGGGVNTVEKAAGWIYEGATKVIIGSKAFQNDEVNRDFLSALAKKIGRRKMIIAIDSRGGKVVTKAWKHDTGLDLFTAVEELEDYAGEFLFTCVEREGCMKGTDMDTIRKLRKTTKNRLTAAGGVTTTDEIKELGAMGVHVQLGMALYTGRIDLGEGFIHSLAWDKMGLIPTIAQDHKGNVLMLAYSSRESLRKTFGTNKMTYYSRSREELWTKGLTSGNIQDFIRIRADCDQDALLATVRPRGPACHLGTYTCFGDRRWDD